MAKGNFAVRFGQPVQVEGVDNVGVGIGHDVHEQFIPFLEGVDVVEGKKGIALDWATTSPVWRFMMWKGVPFLGCQRKFSINGRSHKQQMDRIDPQRKFGHDGVILAQAKAVDVGRPADRHLAD
jgi:hypothetical protein